MLKTGRKYRKNAVNLYRMFNVSKSANKSASLFNILHSNRLYVSFESRPFVQLSVNRFIASKRWMDFKATQSLHRLKTESKG